MDRTIKKKMLKNKCTTCKRNIFFFHSDIIVVILHCQKFISYNWRHYLSITPRTSKLQPTRCSVSWFIYFWRRSTCFRRFLRLSLGAHNCTYSFRYWQQILLLDATVEEMKLAFYCYLKTVHLTCFLRGINVASFQKLYRNHLKILGARRMTSNKSHLRTHK